MALDFRYYDMPQQEPILLFTGQSWVRPYGIETGDQLHFHNIIEIGVCRQGDGRMLYHGGTKPYRTGMISVIPRNIPHSTKSNNGELNAWEYIFLDEEEYLHRAYGDNPAFLEDVRENLNAGCQLFDADSCPDIAYALEQIFRVGADLSMTYASALLQADILEALLLLAQNNKGKKSLVREASIGASNAAILQSLRYIEAHSAEPLRVRDLATQAGMSETLYRETFEQNMNMTPLDYVNMTRVRNACQLLLNRMLSMEEIAEQVGYTTPSTFNRNFRKFTGYSALQWRKMHANQVSQGMGLKITAHRGWE